MLNTEQTHLLENLVKEKLADIESIKRFESKKEIRNNKLLKDLDIVTNEYLAIKEELKR